MKPAPFRYVRASSVDEATVALADNADARILAGGQSLIALMNLRMVKPTCLIDINRVSALDYIKDDGDRIAVGALARHNDVKHSPLIGEGCPLLAEAYESISHHTVRNRGTLGGNLCHADPSSEAPAVMVAVGAEMVLQSTKGTREVAAEDFFQGLYETAARQDELLTEIRIPKRGTEGWAFAEVSNRHGDFAMAAIATTVRMNNGTCDAARVVASGVGEHTARLGPAEQALVGSSLDEASRAAAGAAARDAVDPQTDYHADAEYRRELIDTLTRRTVQQAAQRCG